MDKERFHTLFLNALEVAAENAEARVGQPVPRNFKVELHGLAEHPSLLDPEAAFASIYLGPDRFYRVIDIAVKSVSREQSVVFMAISGHAPSTFDQTWNQPKGSGPFKQIVPKDVVLAS